MNDLSITQEYLLCALNERGKISGFSTEKLVCLVAGGLFELQLENCITVEKKSVTVVNELPESMSYLKPLYEYIKSYGTVKIDKILDSYMFSFTDRELNSLIVSIGNALEKSGSVKSEKSGLLGEKKVYIPFSEAINGVIDKVRAEIMESGPVTDETILLVILLDKSKCIKTYFSKFEQKEIKASLTEIIDSSAEKKVKYMIDTIEGIIAVISATAASTVH